MKVLHCDSYRAGGLHTAPTVEDVEPGGKSGGGIAHPELADELERQVGRQLVGLGAEHLETLGQARQGRSQERGLARAGVAFDPDDPGAAF